MRRRKNLEETIQCAKDFFGDEYEIEKYRGRNILGIRLTDEIKYAIQREIKKINKSERIKEKKYIENIIENNIDKYLYIDKFEILNNYKACRRLTIELTFDTTEKAIEIKKSSNIKSINKLINLILFDYLKKVGAL